MAGFYRITLFPPAAMGITLVVEDEPKRENNELVFVAKSGIKRRTTLPYAIEYVPEADKEYLFNKHATPL